MNSSDSTSPKITVLIDENIIREVILDKERTTLGRRPYNDVVVDNLAVSGEHAAFEKTAQQVYIEDLNSTNGTYINGKPVKKQVLKHGDTIEIGKCKLLFSLVSTAHLNATAAPKSNAAAAPLTSHTIRPGFARTTAYGALPLCTGLIKVISGPSAGREMDLEKVVTTLGKPGVAVAAITRRPSGFVLNHVEGPAKLLLNGKVIGDDPVLLNSGDQLELAGTQMEFVQTN